MFFESRCFWLPKDVAYPGEYEDAFEIDERRGIAAIADGVSSAIFSRRWANILTQSVVDRPPNLMDGKAFGQWLATCRELWSKSINLATLSWSQQLKLEQSGGAFSTLLWVELFETEDPGKFRMRCVALGDSCLFHLRGGAMLQAFPLQHSSHFALSTPSMGSVNRGRDHELEFYCEQCDVEVGDVVVLCTDALALWAFKQLEREQPVYWEKFWPLTMEAWIDRIVQLRGQDEIRCDDTTLLLMRVGEAAEDDAAARRGRRLLWRARYRHQLRRQLPNKDNFRAH